MSSVRLARELCESGYSYAEQARLTRTAQLHRLRRGAYSEADPGLDPRVAHLQLLEATVGYPPPRLWSATCPQRRCTACRYGTTR